MQAEPISSLSLRRPAAPGRRLTISQAGRLCGLTARAIRLYEERGLIDPERDANAVRYYGERELDRLTYIAALRRAGLGIGEIAMLLELGRLQGPAAQRAAMIEVCRVRIAALEGQRRELERLAETALRAQDAKTGRLSAA